MSLPSLDHIFKMMNDQGYIADRQIAMTIFLSIQLNKPVLIEGPAGVGKTEIAKVMAKALDSELIRLQCYEGLDSSHAIYEWNYQHQLLHLKMEEQSDKSTKEKQKEIFSEDFLIKRPLLKALSNEKDSVLLIDEIDRADEEFESYLLEILSEWQLTIPEIGTIKSKSNPRVILTGNRTRELSEALRRRCLYLWIDYPEFEKEHQIILSKIPSINKKLATQITAFMQEVRQLKLEKNPGVAETLDWARALAAMHIDHLEKEIVEDTLGVVLKDWQDMRNTQDSLSELLEKTGVSSRLV